jgi:hypothetical protein
MALSASIKSKNFAAVVRQLRGNDAAILPAAAQALNRGLLEATGVIQTEFLQGPRPSRLGEVTGRLRNSISHDVKITEKGVIGQIGTNVVYGAYHEFGFKGTVQVRAHERHVEDSNWTTAGGRRRQLKQDLAGNVIQIKRESIRSAMKRGVSFVVQQVRSHSRNINYAGRPYVRPGLYQVLPRIRELVNAEISAAMRGKST